MSTARSLSQLVTSSGISLYTSVSAGGTTGTSGQVLQTTGVGVTYVSQSTLNVGSALTLTNTRTLWGQNFNGSANVTGDLSSVGNITGTGAVNLTATSATLGLVATGANVITATTNGSERLRIDSSGNLLINTTTPTTTASQPLQVNGGAYVSGNVGIGTTNPGDALTVLGRVHILQDAGSNSRLVLRAKPGNLYRWSIDNDSTNNFRIFREDDATAANGYVAANINTSGYLTGQIVGLGTGLYPNLQYYRLNSDFAGANVNTAQKIFNVGVTVAGSTTYAFEYFVIFNKTAGTTNHSIQINFGGTATFNNGVHSALVTSSNTSGLVAAQLYTTTITSFLSYGMSTTASVSAGWWGRGTFSVNAGGTVIPQYTLSAAPGGAYSTLAGSYILIYPLGASGSNTSYGTWA